MPRPSSPAARQTLGAALDPRSNALNAIRLALAVIVIGWHAFPLTGSDITIGPLRQLLSRISVDGFFTISGYLIVSSWMRRPHWKSFLVARVLRIFPAFWVSLIVTAAVIAPLSTVVSRGSLPPHFWRGAGSYVISNAALWVNQYPIAATPDHVPYPGVWNGSMWTLAWEFLCYLGVLALGLTALLRRTWVLPALFLLAEVGVLVTSYGPVGNFYLRTGARFGIMFLAGGLLWQFRDRLPVSPAVIVAAAGVVTGSLFLSDYRVLAAVPVAYLLLILGAYGRHRLLQLRNDFSYGTYIFAFPMQQVLATAGGWSLGVPVFAVLSVLVTAPPAVASWFLVEKPALGLKHHRRARTVQDLAVADGDRSSNQPAAGAATPGRRPEPATRPGTSAES